jgi:hypothetical protein
MHVAQRPVPPPLLLALACALAPQVAAPQQPEPKLKAAGVEIAPAQTTAEVGQHLQFHATAKDSAGATLAAKPTLWFATPFDMATADSEGTVVFYQPGEVLVGAVVAGTPGFGHVTVLTPGVATLAVEPVAGPLTVGGTLLLTATARSANGDPRHDQAIEWTALTPAVATVSASGLVSAKQPGMARVRAQTGSATAEVRVRIVADPSRPLVIEAGARAARTGDVVHFGVAGARGGTSGEPLATWSVAGEGAAIYPDGAFVAERPGTYAITATRGAHAVTTSIVVTPRNVDRELDILSHVQPVGDSGKPIETAEEWIIGHHAYLSTIADRIFVYDVADPAHPRLLDTLKVDARLVNDISTTPDEQVGVITREGASNRKNGIVLLDTSDPAHLQVHSEYTETVTGGVHSAFINTHYVYLTDDATGSLRIIDFRDVKHPKEVARYQVPSTTATTIGAPGGAFSSGRFLHDLYVKDGLAYLAYWRDGLVILDVGNGMKGGSPEQPRVVSQYRFNHHELYGDGWLAGTHSVFRYKRYVFVGDEVFPALFNVTGEDRTPARALVHVVDVSDLEQPREVARYEVPEGGTHNFWCDNDMLFLGDYEGGGRVVDISGELRGELYRQGREIARLWTGDPKGVKPNLPFTWGAQPWNGLIYVNDINSGLWIVRLGKPRFKGAATEPALAKPPTAP